MGKCDTTGNYSPLPYINHDERYTITQGLYPLINVPIFGALGGHYYLAVFDSKKNLVTELHGLATTKSGEVIPIGTIGAKLKYYNTADNDFNQAGNNLIFEPNHMAASHHASTVLFEGNGREVEAYIRRANFAGTLMNDQDIDYAAFGISGKEVENSNAVNNTLIRAMGFDNPYTEDPNDAMWRPGKDLLLLPEEDIASIIDMVQPVQPGLFQCWHLPYPPQTLDPLALDLDGDGVISTLPLEKGVYFDLDNSGFAEKTAWIGKEDGLLVFDRNGNGYIDNGTEVFGNETPLADGSIAEHGFAALSDFDTNHDGKVDASDADFALLRVWQDKNSDGRSSSDELFTLAELDISELYTNYQNSTERDNNRVEHREQGTFLLSDGTERAMHTLWFESDKVRSIPIDIHYGKDEPLPDDIAALPTALGSGNVHALHDAMREDDDLKYLVRQFTEETNSDVRKTLSEKILHRWAKTEHINGTSGDMDAQHLATLEAFWGQKALQETPTGDYARRSELVYQDLHNYVHGQLSLQTHYADIFNKIIYKQTNSIWNADYSNVAPLLRDDFVTNKLDKATLTDILDSLRGIAPNIPRLAQELHAAIDAQTDNLTSDQREALQEALYRGDDVIHQHASQISLNAGDGNDTVHGNARDNVIRGGAGNDTLHGNAGNDTLEGGIGNDRLAGGDGQDTYIFAGRFGNDVITAAGDDTVQLQDLNLFEVTFSRNHHDLVLKHEDDTITIRHHFADDTQGIAHILFADGMALDRAGITSAVRIEETVEQLGVNSNNVGFNNIDELLSHYLNNATAHPYDIDALIDGMENGTLDTHQSGEQATLYDIGNFFNHLWGTSQTNPIDRMLDDMENGASHPHTTSTLPYDWTKALEGIW